MSNQTQKYTFQVQGMHCNACVVLTESEIGELPNVKSVKSSLATNSIEVEGNFGDKNIEQIAQELTGPLKPHGYTVLVEKYKNIPKWNEFKIALPVAIGFALLFVILQKAGLVNLVNSGNVTYGTAFVIGVIASLSTCMAVVGGLVLSMSATYAKEGDRIKPQLMFHGSRILSFFVLGGIIGAVGAAFTLNTGATFVLSFVVGLVMLILGVNLLDTFDWARKFQPRMPKFISKSAYGVFKLDHALTPLLFGVATFFLPCGFTQSMQLYTLTTGSFIEGGLTMLAFALGTLPVLALVSFSSLSVQNTSKSGVFFKTSGLIVIIFALFNIINSLVVIGLIPPVFVI